MKKTILSLFLSICSFFLLADGGCGVSIQKSISSDDKGTYAQLSYTVHESGVDCSNCAPYVVWYLKEGGNFIRIAGIPYYNAYKPGMYKVEVCGAYAIMILDSNEVFENKILPDPSSGSYIFSVYPNPSVDGQVKLKVPKKPISLESKIFKVEIFSVLGAQVFIKDNNEFGIGNLSIDLSNQGKGIFVMRVTSGQEVKVMKIVVR